MTSSFDTLFDEADSRGKSKNIPSSNFNNLFNEAHESAQRSKKSIPEKGARLVGQVALGAAENALFPYELGAAHLNQPEAAQVNYRKQLFEDIEDLQQMKQLGGDPGTGKSWDEQDEKLLQHLTSQAESPELSKKFVETTDIGVRGLAEKATGLDLHPEGVLEKTANWIGFIKNPKNYLNIAKTGFKPKEIIKAIAPTGTETLRGFGAGSALELAEQGDFGPIGTMASAVVGDLLGSGIAGVGKFGKKLITQPKKTLAEIGAKFTPKEKIDLQKGVIKDFRDAGIQADLGSITGNNLIKWTQSRLAQSGLSGNALKDFKEQLTNQIKDEYRGIADSLGQLKSSSNHELGIVTKESLKKIRDSDLAETRNFYKEAESALSKRAFVSSNRVLRAVNRIEKQLKPGVLKSGEQQTVLNTLDKLKRDISDSSGSSMSADVKDLMNNKIALNDIINYEVQGGAKQLLKEIVGELDRAIISHGKDNPRFAKNYIVANKRFSNHAKTFRNKNISKLLGESDPAEVMGKMKNIHGIRSLERVLTKSPQGKEIFDNLKRLKIEQLVGDNLVDSTTQQVKLGTFSKLLQKGNNREIIKELLGSEPFKRLEKLQKNAGVLAESAQEYYNASKSGAVAADAAILAKGLGDISWILSGNPWPLLKTVSAVVGTRKLSQLLSDPEFLKLTEDVILTHKHGSKRELFDSIERLRPFIMQALKEDENKNESI
jgi:hypothetical protein